MLRKVAFSLIYGLTFAVTCVTAAEAQQKLDDDLGPCDPSQTQRLDWTDYTDNVYLSVNGRKRFFGVFVPHTYNDDLPAKRKLILDFHGAGDEPLTQYNNSMYYAHELGKEYLVVYPRGVEQSWYGAPYANPASIYDIQFVDQLIDYMTKNYCVDTSQIFASGKSNGGGFVNTLACNDTESKFVAFAMASPALYADSSTAKCPGGNAGCPTPPGPRKILQAHGANDTVMSYTGCCQCDRPHGPNKIYHNVSTPDIRGWVWNWAERNEYDTQQTILDISPYSHVYYNTTGNDGVVSHYRIPNLGHCWPQNDSTVPNSDYQKQSLGCKSYALDFTDTVINFFINASVSTSESNYKKEL